MFTTAPALINLAVPPGTTLYQLAPSLNQEVLPRGPATPCALAEATTCPWRVSFKQAS